MTVPVPGAIDCDIHPALPAMQALVPYLDEYWREHVLTRGLERDNYTASAFPPNAPLNCRPDWRRRKAPPAPIWPCCGHRRSMHSARAMPSATCSTARR